MIIADVVSPEFTIAFNKILMSDKLTRPDRRKLKIIAAPIQQAQKKYQYSHGKAINKFGERDKEGRIVEVPLPNGMSKYKLAPETEAEFHEVIEILRNTPVELPEVKLEASAMQCACGLLPGDELILAEILQDTVPVEAEALSDGPMEAPVLALRPLSERSDT